MKRPAFWYALLAAAGCAFVGGVFYYLAQSVPQASAEMYTLTEPHKERHAIILTKDGFVPDTIVIRQGETVTFSTNTGEPFWPASSLHPTHTIYPEFDPKERIMPEDTWSFTFDRAGKWKFHDHINALQTGLIVVLSPEEEKTGVSKALSVDDCTKFEDSQKQQCWDEQLQTVLEQQGLDAAFDYFIKLYKTEPDVPKACHEWGHTLGEASYRIYKETGELTLRPEAAYCGYGFFHSFIAELVKDTGNFDEVLTFCERVNNELQEKLPGIAGNCVHGVGHGTTAWLFEDPRNWGDLQRTATQGTEICNKIFSTQSDLTNCYDGVFNELHLDLFNDEYGLSFDAYMKSNDPFWFCQEQPEEQRSSCYFEFVGIFWHVFDGDLMKAIAYVLKNTQGLEERGPVVISKMAADWIQHDIVKDSVEEDVIACRSVPSFLFDSCMQGLANGFIQHGEPDNLEKKGYAFCSASYLSPAERSLCFNDLTQLLHSTYSPERFEKACALLPAEDMTDICSSPPAP